MTDGTRDDDRLERIEDSLVRIEGRMADFDRHVIEANMRLENGQRSFQSHEKRLTEAEGQLRPSLTRIAGWIASVGISITAVVWTTATMQAEHPTFVKVAQMIDERPNPELKRKADEHERAIAKNTSLGERLEDKLSNVLDTVNEIKTELRERRGARR